MEERIEPILTRLYETNKKFVIRLGKRVLKKNIGFHLFRYSSATFYAPKLNRHELCYRYGWTFSSRMPDVYISRSGMLNKELDVKFTATEIEELRLKFEKELRELRMKSEHQEKFMNAFCNQLQNLINGKSFKFYNKKKEVEITPQDLILAWGRGSI